MTPIESLISDVSKSLPKSQQVGKNFVYIVRNFDKKIIYIGVANDVYRRMDEHSKQAKWYDPNLVLEKYAFDTYEDALITEGLLINYFQPEANKRGYWKDDIGRRW